MERLQIKELVRRMDEPRRFIQVLAGPRQVGKTTLINQLMARLTVPHTLVTADITNEDNNEWISDQWTAVRREMLVQGESEHILVIDEIQRINNWSIVVKREWDADTQSHINLKLILLGSSRLLIKDGLEESLAGRFELIRVPHWSFAEMRDAFGFSLEQYIYFGGYPGSASLINEPKRWKRYVRQSIVAPAIEKDVLMTKRILKPALMRQVFDIGANHSGELISLNKMVGQLQDAGNTTTVSNYLHTLGEAELLIGLQQYAPDIVRQYQSIPKMQVFNSALQTVYQSTDFLTTFTDRPLWGRRVESAVGTHLMAFAADEDYKVYYWRERNDEIDFVLVQGETTLGIEVKSGQRSAGEGLRAFSRRFPTAHTLVVGTGGVPLDVFFTTNPADWLVF